MAVLIDMECSGCGARLTDQSLSTENTRHCAKGKLEWAPSMTRVGSTHCAESEKCVVFVSESEGQVAYPMTNNRDIPKHLRGRGYERREMTPNHLGAFEKKHGVVSQIRHFNRNGRGMETD